MWAFADSILESTPPCRATKDISISMCSNCAQKGERVYNGMLYKELSFLQEQQIRQLLDVTTARQAVIAKDAAIVPEFGNDCWGEVCHLLGGF